MDDGPLHGSFFEIGVGGAVLVLPIIAVHLLVRELLQESVALLVAFDTMEIIRIAEKPFDVDLLIGVVYVLRGGDGTAYLGHPLHPPIVMFGPHPADDVGLLLGPPGLHLQGYAGPHMNHQ